MKTLNTNFKTFSLEPSLRYDFNYISFVDSEVATDYLTFSDLFDIRNEKCNIKDTGDFYYAEIKNVTNSNEVMPILLNFDKQDDDLDNSSLYTKIKANNIIKPSKNDILIPITRPNLKKYISIDYDKENYYYTSAFIDLVPKKIPKILYYSLKDTFYKNLMAVSRIGKGYPTLRQDDLNFIRFSKEKINKLIINEKALNDIIVKNETEMNSLLKEKKLKASIINDVFSNYFNYDNNLINMIRKGMTYGTQMSHNVALNIFTTNFNSLDGKMLRNSVRANSPIFEELEQVINNSDYLDLKEILTSAITNGVKPEYSIDGVVPVIKTAYLTNDGISDDINEFVTESYYNSKLQAQIRLNDILMCNIGKCSCGKIDIKNDDKKAFATTEVMIIRVNEAKYNTKFLLYFLKSPLGIYQIEKSYTGTTNQIHLNPKDVEHFLIPNIDINEQNKIVEKIEKSFDKQDLIEREINSKNYLIEKEITRILN